MIIIGDALKVIYEVLWDWLTRWYFKIKFLGKWIFSLIKLKCEFKLFTKKKVNLNKRLLKGKLSFTLFTWRKEQYGHNNIITTNQEDICGFDIWNSPYSSYLLIWLFSLIIMVSIIETGPWAVRMASLTVLYRKLNISVRI